MRERPEIQAMLWKEIKKHMLLNQKTLHGCSGKGGEVNGCIRTDESRITGVSKSISGSEGFTLT